MHSLFSFENAMFQSPHWPLTSLIYLIHIIKNFLPTKITFSPITPNKLCFSEPPLYCYIDIFMYISCSFPFHMKEVQITDMVCQLHGILRDASSFQLSILLSLCNVPQTVPQTVTIVTVSGRKMGKGQEPKGCFPPEPVPFRKLSENPIQEFTGETRKERRERNVVFI